MLYQGGYNVHGFYGLSNYCYRNGDAALPDSSDSGRAMMQYSEVRFLIHTPCTGTGPPVPGGRCSDAG